MLVSKPLHVPLANQAVSGGGHGTRRQVEFFGHLRGRLVVIHRDRINGVHLLDGQVREGGFPEFMFFNSHDPVVNPHQSLIDFPVVVIHNAFLLSLF